MADPSPPSERPPLNILGEKVALGPLRRELVPLYTRWLNDYEVTSTLGVRIQPMTREAEELWYDGASKGKQGYLFTVYERASLRPIGTTSLRNVDHLHRTAEFGIVIGERECWGKGYGTEATTLMLDYGFTALGLHNIMLTVLSDNQRGIRAYARAGFRELGRRREARWRGGRLSDVVYMDCLSTEFRSSVMTRLLEGESAAPASP